MARVVVRTRDEIPDEQYRKMVLTLMDKQAGREVATAEVFGQCVIHAPTVEDKIRITRYQAEELKHFKLIARLMAELGVDMDAYVRNRQKAGARFTGDAADDQIEDWIAATLFMARCGLRFPKREELPIELPPQVELAVPAL